MLFAVVSDTYAVGVRERRRHHGRQRDRTVGLFGATLLVGSNAVHAVAAQDDEFFGNQLHALKEAFVERRVPHVEVEFAFVVGHGNRHIVAYDLVRDLNHHFGHRRVDLPRHDGGSGREGRKIDFHPAGAGA